MTRHRADDLGADDLGPEDFHANDRGAGWRRPTASRFGRVKPARRGRRSAGRGHAAEAKRDPDLSLALEYIVATEQPPMRLPGPPAEPAGGQPTVRQIPVGIRHAVGASLGRHGTGPGRERTACGLDATGFHCFEQLDWITTVNQCPDCGQAMAN